MTDRSREDELNLEIMDCLTEFIKRGAALAQGIAQVAGLPLSDLVALHKLDGPMTMKEFGRRLHCDPSFATMMTNALEKRGLARREPSERDRRSKNVVLTAEGTALKKRLEQELARRLPWASALDVSERRCLHGHLRKVLAALDPERTAGCGDAGGAATSETTTMTGKEQAHSVN